MYFTSASSMRIQYLGKSSKILDPLHRIGTSFQHSPQLRSDTYGSSHGACKSTRRSRFVLLVFSRYRARCKVRTYPIGCNEPLFSPRTARFLRYHDMESLTWARETIPRHR